MKPEVFIFIVFVIIALLIWYAIKRHFKQLKLPSVAMVTGGVKTGKTKLCVKLSIKDFKKRHRKWFLAKYLFHKDIEEPLYYTNATISFGNRKSKYRHRLDKCIVEVNKELLQREVRFAYGSVIYIEEASLLADNMDFKDKERNVDLSLFAKLIAHETRGGVLYIDTQSVQDVHYAFKRVSSSFLFIQKRYDFKLFDVLYVREMINTEIGVNNFEEDVDVTMRKIIIPFWYNHKYDRYEFSHLTDDLDVSKTPFKKKKKVVSFNPLYEIRGYKGKEGKKK